MAESCWASAQADAGTCSRGIHSDGDPWPGVPWPGVPWPGVPWPGAPKARVPKLEHALARRQSIANRPGPPTILAFAGWLRKCHDESHWSYRSALPTH